METRTEVDSLGAVEVPADRHWGAQTQRCLTQFEIGSGRMPLELVHALGHCKRAAAQVHGELGGLPPELAEAIHSAAAEVAAGKWDDHFPLGVWQTGSGTQTHMNVNEVIASRANELLTGRRGGKEPVHPNDHVNLGQSSNDTFPTAMHVASVIAIEQRLLPALRELESALAAKAGAFDEVVKIGRTHLQDAVPLTVGQEFATWARQVAAARAGVQASLPGLLELAQGGTAVGTGLNAPPEFAARFAAELSAALGYDFVPAPLPHALIAAHDAMVALSGALNTAAVALNKVANDVRLLASGPRCGLGELLLPQNEPGSSIMPGKVNPTQAEALTMVCARVIGNHTTVTMAGAQGHLQLQAFKPVIVASVLESIALLADSSRSFTEHCVVGIELNRPRIAELLERSLMLVTALVPHLGYDQAAKIAQHAQAEGTSLRAAALSLGVVTAEQFDAWVVPADMARAPGEG